MPATCGRTARQSLIEINQTSVKVAMLKISAGASHHTARALPRGPNGCRQACGQGRRTAKKVGRDAGYQHRNGLVQFGHRPAALPEVAQNCAATSRAELWCRLYSCQGKHLPRLGILACAASLQGINGASDGEMRFGLTRHPAQPCTPPSARATDGFLAASVCRR